MTSDALSNNGEGRSCSWPLETGRIACLPHLLLHLLMMWWSWYTDNEEQTTDNARRWWIIACLMAVTRTAAAASLLILPLHSLAHPPPPHLVSHPSLYNQPASLTSGYDSNNGHSHVTKDSHTILCFYFRIQHLSPDAMHVHTQAYCLGRVCCFSCQRYLLIVTFVTVAL